MNTAVAAAADKNPAIQPIPVEVLTEAGTPVHLARNQVVKREYCGTTAAGAISFAAMT